MALNGFQQSGRRSKAKLLLLVVVAAALMGVSYQWQSAYATQLATSKGTFVASKECEPRQDHRSGCRQQLVQAVVRAPLGDDAFAGVVRIDKALGREHAQRGEALLSQMGFRSTLGQQLLITSALQRRDFVEILLRGDSLLRRGKLEDEVLPVMIVAAGDPSTREPLIKSLVRQPSWRLSFMTHPTGFSRPALRSVRADLLEEMLERKIPVDQIEIAYAVRALAQAQENERAYDLWQLHRGLDDKQAAVFDPRFRLLEQDHAANIASSMPFEWTLLKGRGFRAQLRTSSKQNMLTLSWNGRGNPVLLEQKIRVDAGRRYNVAVIASEPAAVVARRFVITLDCPGAASVQFSDFQPAPSPGKPETMLSEEPVACAFPVLRVRGNAVDAGERGGKTSISYMNLVRAN